VVVHGPIVATFRVMGWPSRKSTWWIARSVDDIAIGVVAVILALAAIYGLTDIDSVVDNLAPSMFVFGVVPAIASLLVDELHRMPGRITLVLTSRGPVLAARPLLFSSLQNWSTTDGEPNPVAVHRTPSGIVVEFQSTEFERSGQRVNIGHLSEEQLGSLAIWNTGLEAHRVKRASMLGQPTPLGPVNDDSDWSQPSGPHRIGSSPAGTTNDSRHPGAMGF
jgi:hypothetical protein